MAGSIKLDLGCGPKKREGFVGVDLAGNWSGVAPDVVADISQKLPFDDCYADEVHSYHVVEHFHRWKISGILAEWVRVLKPGGLMVVECPCLDKIISLMAHYLIDRQPMDSRLTLWGLFGDPHYEDETMAHKWCYSYNELEQILASLGLKDIKREPPQTHQKVRDMRITAVK